MRNGKGADIRKDFAGNAFRAGNLSQRQKDYKLFATEAGSEIFVGPPLTASPGPVEVRS